jgi:catechol 2,3-dioxygenase-like lactoylglutathione lyase family enzyme
MAVEGEARRMFPMASAIDIEYVVYGQSDLGRTEAFFTDFGLTVSSRLRDELLFRAAASGRYCYVAKRGVRPGLHAIGMRVASIDALHDAAKFPEASPVEAIERPGGGWCVRLSSPDGIPFELVHGIEQVEPIPVRAPLVFNHSDRKNRTGSWQRTPLEPARVVRLGHIALTTVQYARNAAWLHSRLGMEPSDVLFDGSSDNLVGGFFHCDGSDGWTDHHTIAVFPGPGAGTHHCSFEVQDIDTEFMGNKYLSSKGWNSFWGVGRHILGSQIFDYWFDPEGNVVEHFTDGDVVKPGHKAEFHQVSDNSLAQWGPPMPVTNFIQRLPFKN